MQTVIEHADKIDSLPYIDPHDDHAQRQAEALVRDEMRRFAPQDYLAQLPSFSTAKYDSVFLEGETERLKRGEPMARVDITRYKVEAPPPSKKNDPDAWNIAVRNAQAQLEHQYLRLLNLELLNNYGSNAWKMHNYTLEALHKSVSQSLAQCKKEVEDVNRARKLEQESAAHTLSGLAVRYEDLVRKNYDIETACLLIEQELQDLHSKLESKLQPAS